MTTTTKRPYCYLTLDQVQDSRLLPASRMAEIEAEIERRISTPLLTDGRSINTCKVADLSPEPAMVYPRIDSDSQWSMMKRDILQVVLTEEEIDLLNRHGLSTASERRKHERFEKARKVPAAEYSGMVTNGDQYWDDVESYREQMEEEELSTAKYVWATKPTPVITSRDVADVFESQMCDRGWEDMEVSDLKGVEELRKAIDAFVAANENVVSYWPDYSLAVVL